MKTPMLKSLAVAAALVLATLGTAQAATLKLSHVRPQGTAIDKDANWYASEVEKATGGKIKIKIYAASSLGDYTVVQERVGVGAVEMAVQPPSSAADKRFQLVYFPYLTRSWEDARRVFAAGSPLRNTVAELYAKQDIHVLAAWPVYFGGISLNREVPNAGDPSSTKGVKVRVPGMKTFQMLAENVGYIPSPIPFSEAFTAVQTGVVDGVIGSGAEGYYASFRDVTKYYVPMNTHFEVWYLIINAGTFADLGDAEKAALEKVSAEFESRRWSAAEADQAANEQRLVAAGATIVPVSKAHIDAAADKIRANVWPVIVDDVGKAWGQPVLDAITKN